MPAKVVTTHATLEFPRGGSMRLAVVADTHSRPHPKTKERLTELAPDAILHAGDVGDLEVLEGLREIAPVYAVRGNIDGREPSLPDVMLIDVTDGEATLRLLLTHIAVGGTRLRPEVRKRALAAGAKLVVCGHSHIPFIARDAGMTVYNPGSVGPKRFHLPILFGAIELGPKGVTLAHYECETGHPWSPP